MEYLKSIITDFKNILFSKINKNIVSYMYLYGSYARGEASDKSDLDICIIYDDTLISELNINLIVDDISENLLDKYNIVINALCFKKEYYETNKNSSPLFKNIKKEGISCL